MSSTAHIRVNLDTNNAEKDLRSLNKEAQKTNVTFKGVDKTFEEVYGDLKPLTGRMGEAEDRLYELALAGKQSTAEFKALLNETVRLRSTMIQTDMVVDAMSQTLSNKLLAGAGGVAGTFAVAQGAMAAFGSESEALNSALTKLAGVMAALQGIRELRESLPILQGLFSGMATNVTAAAGEAEKLGGVMETTSEVASDWVSTGAELVGAGADIKTANAVAAASFTGVETAVISSAEAAKKYDEVLSDLANNVFDPTINVTQEDLDSHFSQLEQLRQQRDAEITNISTELDDLRDTMEINEGSAKRLADAEEAVFEVKESKIALQKLELEQNMASFELDNIRMEQALAEASNDTAELDRLAVKHTLKTEELALLNEEIANHTRNIAVQTELAGVEKGRLVLERERQKEVAGLNNEANALKKAEQAVLGATKANISFKDILVKTEEVLAKFANSLIKLATSPIAVFAAAIAAAAGFVYSLSQVLKTTNEDSGAQERRNKLIKEGKKLLVENTKAVDEAAKAIAHESTKFFIAITHLKHSNELSGERAKLIKEINKTYGTTLKNLSDETSFQQQLNIAVNEYLNFQRQKFLLSKYETKVNTLLEDQYKLEAELRKLRDPATLATWNKETLKGGNAQERVNETIAETEKKLTNVIFELDKYAKLSLKAAEETENKYVPAQNKITEAFKESFTALKAYTEARDDDAKRPIEQTKYEIEIRKIEMGLKALENKRLAAYEEEKKNAEGLYKNKEITKAAYDARLLKADKDYTEQSLIVQQIWADKRTEFEANWTEEQLKIKKTALATAQKLEAQSALDTLNYQKDLALKNIDAEKLTQIQKEKKILEVKQDYLDKSVDLIETNRKAELVLLEAGYEQQLDDINLNEEQKAAITAQYISDKIKVNETANTKLAEGEAEVTAAIKSELEIRMQAMQEFTGVYEDLAGSLGTLLSDSLGGDLDNVAANFDQFTKALIDTASQFDTIADKWDDLDLKGKISTIANAAVQAATIATEAIGSLFTKQAEDQAALTQQRYEEEDQALAQSLEARLISQDEYDSQLSRNEKIRADEERAARRLSFEQGKKLAKSNAIIGVANAVIQALATLPPPASYVAAAVSGVMGGAQLGIIDKQKFTASRGGKVPGNGNPNQDSVDALLAPGEMVINSRSSGMFPALLSAINQAGGGIPLAPIPPTQKPMVASVFGSTNEVRAYVVENDITRSQRRVNRLEKRGSY